MRCSLCNKRRKLFEAYLRLNDKVALCQSCNILTYKVKAAIEDDKDNELKKQLEYIDKISIHNKDFEEWFNQYVERLKKDKNQ